MRIWTSSQLRRRLPGNGRFSPAPRGVAVAGCGEKDFANDPRPPAPVELTALINDKKVIVSPQPEGAGPVTITISNQSKDPAKLTLTEGDVSS